MICPLSNAQFANPKRQNLSLGRWFGVESAVDLTGYSIGSLSRYRSIIRSAEFLSIGSQVPAIDPKYVSLAEIACRENRSVSEG